MSDIFYMYFLIEIITFNFKYFWNDKLLVLKKNNCLCIYVDNKLFKPRSWFTRNAPTRLNLIFFSDKMFVRWLHGTQNMSPISLESGRDLSVESLSLKQISLNLFH